MLPNGWNETTLGAALRRVVEPVKVDVDDEYQEIGIRSHGKGIFHKPAVMGAELGDKRVFHVVPNALIFNIVFAWEQAVAVTTEHEKGKIASHRFPMYLPKDGQCDVEYLRNYFCTKRGKEMLELASPGGAGRNKTLGQREFEKISIAMPPLMEQQQISKALLVWNRAILIQERLIENTLELKAGLMQRLLPKIHSNQKLPKGWSITSIGECATMNPSRPARPLDGQVTFLAMEAVSEDGRVLRPKTRNYSEVATGYTSFINGDILVAKITPCFENGKGALVTNLTNGIGFGSTEFHVLRPKSNTNASLLAHIVGSQEFRVRGATEMVGSAGHKRVAVSFIDSFRFAEPISPKEKAAIVSMLNVADRLRFQLRSDLEALKLQRAVLAYQLTKGICRFPNRTEDAKRTTA